MADNNPRRTPSKLKASLKELFSRKKKSDANLSATASTQPQETAPSSISAAANASIPAEMEGHPAPRQVSGPNTSYDAPSPQPLTNTPDVPTNTGIVPAQVPLTPPPKAPGRGMSATSGPLDDFESAQAKDKDIPQTPTEAFVEEKPNTPTNRANIGVARTSGSPASGG